MIKRTTDLETIQSWAKQFNATPQLIDDPKAKGDSVGIRLDFPGSADDVFLPKNDVKSISWQQFFDEFTRQDLVFQYDSTAPTYKFIPQSSIDNPEIAAKELKNQKIAKKIAEARKRG